MSGKVKVVVGGIGITVVMWVGAYLIARYVESIPYLVEIKA